VSNDLFIPYAVIETANWPPTSVMTIWALGAANLKRIDFDLSQPEETYIDQALAGLQAKLYGWGGKKLPSFGKPVPIVINLEPNEGVRIYLDGTMLDKLDWTMVVASASMSDKYKRASLKVGKWNVTMGVSHHYP
jgi:hypothetical protein